MSMVKSKVRIVMVDLDGDAQSVREVLGQVLHLTCGMDNGDTSPAPEAALTQSPPPAPTGEVAAASGSAAVDELPQAQPAARQTGIVRGRRTRGERTMYLIEGREGKFEINEVMDLLHAKRQEVYNAAYQAKRSAKAWAKCGRGMIRRADQFVAKRAEEADAPGPVVGTGDPTEARPRHSYRRAPMPINPSRLGAAPDQGVEDDDD